MTANAPHAKRLYLSPPHMGDLERNLLLDAFDSNFIAPLGPHVDALEAEVAATLPGHDVAALSSGTAALHLALHLLGVGPGDEVILPTFTFVATANAVLYCGATPVFIDSDPADWNLDPNLVEQELRGAAGRGRLPKAVIAVDLYGRCANYTALQALCDRYDVPLVEDAAEAMGAAHAGKQAGTFGAIGIFSLNGNKIITSSGGGLFVSRHKTFVQAARSLATQARDPAPHYQHSRMGFNYRMSNLLAAVARGQFTHLKERVARRRAIGALYKKRLDVPGISFAPSLSEDASNNWLTCICINKDVFMADREAVRLQLERFNMESRPLWKPLHMQPLFEKARFCGGQVARQLFRVGLCLPTGSAMTDDDVERVVDVIKATPHA